jgi:cytochrome c oxidase subunit 1
MSTAIEYENYLTNTLGWKSWFFTRDHKRIALMFLLTVTFFFFVGGTFATLIRLELMTPQADLFTSETYNKLFSMHGIIMVWFFLIPSIPTVFENFLLPMMIGARISISAIESLAGTAGAWRFVRTVCDFERRGWIR